MELQNHILSQMCGMDWAQDNIELMQTSRVCTCHDYLFEVTVRSCLILHIICVHVYFILHRACGVISSLSILTKITAHIETLPDSHNPRTRNSLYPASVFRMIQLNWTVSTQPVVLNARSLITNIGMIPLASTPVSSGLRRGLTIGGLSRTINCFWTDWELSNFLCAFLNGWKKFKKIIFCDTWNLTKFTLLNKGVIRTHPDLSFIFCLWILCAYKGKTE